MTGLAEFQAQLPGPLRPARRLDVGVAAERREQDPEAGLHLQLAAGTLARAGSRAPPGPAAAALRPPRRPGEPWRPRLRRGRTAGPSPPHRPGPRPEVVSKPDGIVDADLFERLPDPRMEPGAAHGAELLVQGLGHQGVDEPTTADDLGCLHDEAGPHGRLDGGQDLLVLASGGGGERPELELPSHHRSQCEDRRRLVGQEGDTVPDDVSHAAREPLGEHRLGAVLRAFEERHQLGDEEGVAPGTVPERFDHLLGGRRPRRSLHEQSDVARREARQPDAGGPGSAQVGQGGPQLGRRRFRVAVGAERAAGTRRAPRRRTGGAAAKPGRPSAGRPGRRRLGRWPRAPAGTGRRSRRGGTAPSPDRRRRSRRGRRRRLGARGRGGPGLRRRARGPSGLRRPPPST